MKSGTWQLQKVLQDLKNIPAGEEPYLEPFEHGTMSLGMYAPGEKDLQESHTKDDLYFVISGSGTFVNDGKRSPFSEGDALFVAAGVEHRFEDYSQDFAAWVVFWGPDGGEVN